MGPRCCKLWVGSLFNSSADVAKDWDKKSRIDHIFAMAERIFLNTSLDISTRP